MTKPACGKHTQLSKNAEVRVTQCPCGSVHLTLLKRGITLQLGADALRSTAQGLAAAAEAMATDESLSIIN